MRMTELGRRNHMKHNDFKGQYTKLFPTKISSSSFLMVYTLYLLEKHGAMYGKEILDMIEKHLHSEIWNPSHGTLYPLLTQMEEEKWIKEDHTEASRKFYRITSNGLKVLKDKLEVIKPTLFKSYEFLAKSIMDLYDISPITDVSNLQGDDDDDDANDN